MINETTDSDQINDNLNTNNITILSNEYIQKNTKPSILITELITNEN